MHTPRPWEARKLISPGPIVVGHVFKNVGFTSIADVPLKADADYIVHCVNAFPAMLGALKRVSPTYGSRNLPGNEGTFERLVDEINAAIAMVEGVSPYREAEDRAASLGSTEPGYLHQAEEDK